jgi:WD40 repeat protein
MVMLWGAEGKRKEAALTFHSEKVIFSSFNPTGKWLASGCESGSIILWEVGTRKAMKLLKGHTGNVHALAFTGNGMLLASEGHQDSIPCVAFSPTGGLLASASHDGTVRLWDVAKTVKR